MAVQLYQMMTGMSEQLRKEMGEQKEELIHVLTQLGEAFAFSGDEFGETSVVEHSINTNNASLVATSLHHIPYSLRGE